MLPLFRPDHYPLPLSAKPRENRLHRLCSGQLVGHLAAQQQHNDRDAAYRKASRQGLVILGIYLHHYRLAGNFFGNSSHRRCE